MKQHTQFKGDYPLLVKRTEDGKGVLYTNPLDPAVTVIHSGTTLTLTSNSGNITFEGKDGDGTLEILQSSKYDPEVNGCMNTEHAEMITTLIQQLTPEITKA